MSRGRIYLEVQKLQEETRSDPGGQFDQSASETENLVIDKLHNNISPLTGLRAALTTSVWSDLRSGANCSHLLACSRCRYKLLPPP